jgi:hypothetical protein
MCYLTETERDGNMGIWIRQGWFTRLIIAQTETMIDRKIRIQKANSSMMVCVLV